MTNVIETRPEAPAQPARRGMTGAEEFEAHQAAVSAERRAHGAVEDAQDALQSLAGRSALRPGSVPEEQVQTAKDRLAAARAELEYRSLAVRVTRELPSVRGRR